MHKQRVKQTISDRKIKENIKIYIWIDLFAYMYMDTVGNKTIQMFGSFGLCIEYIF